MTDAEFMTHIICEICDYAVENGMEPDDTLHTIAVNIKALLRISTFNNFKSLCQNPANSEDRPGGVWDAVDDVEDGDTE